MKRIALALLALLMVVTLLTGCSGTDGASDKTLTIGVSGEYFPFCFSEGDDVKGFEIDMWNEIGKRMGDYKVEFTLSDFSGLLGMLDSGKIDTIGYGVAINDERQEKYYFSDEYLYADYSVVTKKDSDLDVIEDFVGKKIAVVMGAEGERRLSALCEAEGLDIEIVGYEGPAQMDEDVVLGRVDARMAPKIQTLVNIKKNDLDMEVTDIVIYTEKDAYPFAKTEQNLELVEKVNEVLNSMREDGTLSELSIKWFDIDATAVG